MEQEIVPNLWFDTEAEEAAEFYCSVFPNSRIVRVAPYPEGGMREAGTTMVVEFEAYAGDPERARRVWDAMQSMRKLDMAALQAAAASTATPAP